MDATMANYGGSNHDSEEDGRAVEMGFQQEDCDDEDEGEGAGLAQARNDGNESEAGERRVNNYHAASPVRSRGQKLNPGIDLAMPMPHKNH
jgi:hypothetical protein